MTALQLVDRVPSAYQLGGDSIHTGQFLPSNEKRLADPVAIHIRCLGFGKKAVRLLGLLYVVRHQLG
jgi:hypothetical protein